MAGNVAPSRPAGQGVACSERRPFRGLRGSFKPSQEELGLTELLRSTAALDERQIAAERAASASNFRAALTQRTSEARRVIQALVQDRLDFFAVESDGVRGYEFVGTGMRAPDLRAARVAREWSQVEAAERLGVSQPYLAMLERGQRRLTPKLAHRAAKVYTVVPTAVPRSQRELPPRLNAATLARDLAGLGYPGFAYLRPRHWTPKNPGDVLLGALAQGDLEPRLVEALPWLVLRYATLDWSWVVREAKVRDLQNRLGFVVGLARQLAVRVGYERKARPLVELEEQLDRSRLAREDTLCRTSLPEPERRWRAFLATRWRLCKTSRALPHRSPRWAREILLIERAKALLLA